jgi:hypothetical protein
MDSRHDHRRELIKELQERWTCSVHTHSDNPIYCYFPSDNNVMCYQLTIMRLGMWAMEIICYKFRATPPTLTNTMLITVTR